MKTELTYGRVRTRITKILIDLDEIPARNRGGKRKAFEEKFGEEAAKRLDLFQEAVRQAVQDILEALRADLCQKHEDWQSVQGTLVKNRRKKVGPYTQEAFGRFTASLLHFSHAEMCQFLGYEEGETPKEKQLLERTFSRYYGWLPSIALA